MSEREMTEQEEMEMWRRSGRPLTPEERQAVAVRTKAWLAARRKAEEQAWSKGPQDDWPEFTGEYDDDPSRTDAYRDQIAEGIFDGRPRWLDEP